MFSIFPTAPLTTEVGSDPNNRGGIGVNTDNVHSLGGRIKKCGWSDSAPQPICITRQPGSRLAAAQDFNKTMVKISAGRLPEVDPDKMAFFALSCNHTVWFLKCVGAALPSEDPKLSLGGRLSVALIEQTDQAFGRRIREGLRWTVISWKAGEFYPELVELFCKAKNAPGEVNQRTSTFETLTEIHSLSRTVRGADGCPDWTQIRKLIGRSEPQCMEMLTELVEFIVGCSGGDSGKFLRELTDLWKNCGLGPVSSERKIPQELWRALGAAGSPGGDPMCRLKNMCVLATLTAEKKTVQNGICKLFEAGDCAVFNDPRKTQVVARLRDCHQALNDGFQLLDRCSRSLPLRSGAPSSSSGAPSLGPSELKLLFACRVARFALSAGGKQKQRETEVFKTVGAIGFLFLEGLRAICPQTDYIAGELVNTWKPDVQEEGGSTQTAPPGIRLREISAEGKLADVEDQLHEAGFRVGDHLRQKRSGEVYVIDSCADNTLVVKDFPAKTITDATTKTLKDLLENYSRPPAGYESRVLHEDLLWARLDPRQSRGGAAALAKADTMGALEIAAKLHPDDYQSVQPMLNLKNAPAGVRASKGAKAGTIVLVPWTSNVAVDWADEPRYKEPVLWEVSFPSGSPLEPLSPKTTLPRISLSAASFKEKLPTAAAEKGKEGKDEAEKVEEGKEGKDKAEKGKAEQDKPRDRLAVFWRVQGFAAKEKKPDDFNMELGRITVDAFGSIQEQSRKIGARGRSKPDFAVTARTTKVCIPVLVNKRDVLQDEVLAYLKPDPPKKDKEAVPVNQRTLLEYQLRRPAPELETDRAVKRPRLD